MNIQKAIVACVASVALVVGAAATAVAQSAPQPPEQASAQQDPAPIRGDLVKVDAAAKMITVKPAAGEEVTFAYTDATEVSGAKDDTAGLATLTEGRVTVHFEEDAQSKTKVATKIIVEPKQ